jgi:hypothetical protein
MNTAVATLDCPVDLMEKTLLENGAPLGMVILSPKDFPTRHTFEDGIYLREVFVEKGRMIVGHRHRSRTINILAGGTILVSINGRPKMITAPATIVSESGTRKAAIAIEDVTWINVHSNPDNERDLGLLEDRYIEKTDVFLEHEQRELEALTKCLG